MKSRESIRRRLTNETFRTGRKLRDFIAVIVNVARNRREHLERERDIGRRRIFQSLKPDGCAFCRRWIQARIRHQRRIANLR